MGIAFRRGLYLKKETSSKGRGWQDAAVCTLRTPDAKIYQLRTTIPWLVGIMLALPPLDIIIVSFPQNAR